MGLPCVIPVAAVDALAWSEGRLNDHDLLMRSPITPEAIFVVDLPDRGALRDCLCRILYWHRAGAVCMIARTGNNAVDDYLTRRGGVPTFREMAAWAATPEERIKYRFLLLPEALHGWMARHGQGQRPPEGFPRDPDAMAARFRLALHAGG